MRLTHRATAASAVRLTLQGIVVAGCAQAALAAPPQLTSERGLLVLPNVRVEAAPQPVDGKATRAEAGMKAYKDRETGKLRKATPEELQEEAAVAAPSNDAAGARVSVAASGRKTAMLDESFMSYAVVRKGPGGQLEHVCVTGETEAAHALHAKPTSTKERRHAH